MATAREWLTIRAQEAPVQRGEPDQQLLRVRRGALKGDERRVMIRVKM